MKKARKNRGANAAAEMVRHLRRQAEEAQRAQLYYTGQYDKAPRTPEDVADGNEDAYWAGQIQALESGQIRAALTQWEARAGEEARARKAAPRPAKSRSTGARTPSRATGARAPWKTPRLSPAQHRKGREMVSAWKWYEPNEFDEQLTLTEWDDPDYPEGVLVECGYLARIHIRAPGREVGGRHPRRQRDTAISFHVSSAKQNQLAFDPEHPDDRLYMLVEPTARKSLASRFWEGNDTAPRMLEDWALMAGGRHSRGGYPRVMAKPMGVMTAVVYYTTKKDDGPSFYIHLMGEMTCHFPILCCDAQGRLWICGGNYTSPTPGITN
jgi:hypothetical protein